jgi:hypothetical protein
MPRWGESRQQGGLLTDLDAIRSCDFHLLLQTSEL